jgi:hypoxanthine-DNA glycosylase
MPSEESLRAGQYYAHPRNAFWPIMADLLGAVPGLAYAERARLLTSAGIALWDVLASCRRKGSLDSAIAADSIVVNDFPAFFQAHPGIAQVLFNGTMAEKCFHKYVRGALAGRALRFTRLPSTSPAHAGLPLAQKREAWRAAILAER